MPSRLDIRSHSNDRACSPALWAASERGGTGPGSLAAASRRVVRPSDQSAGALRCDSEQLTGDGLKVVHWRVRPATWMRRRRDSSQRKKRAVVRASDRVPALGSLAAASHCGSLKLVPIAAAFWTLRPATWMQRQHGPSRRTKRLRVSGTVKLPIRGKRRERGKEGSG
ncbi:hypothetical protein C8T65DRAFT_742387 [Cerioporus squamosus]|nr:hypothetical protein C8T65DRAFT_742387 [Cerioporus squamosus]